MTPSKHPFDLIYDPDIRQHLSVIERKHRSLIRQTIEEQLSFEPNVETPNRKPLSRSAAFGENTWEIRFGPRNQFRVFYRTDLSQREIRILAIGIKRRNQLWIGGERFDL